MERHQPDELAGETVKVLEKIMQAWRLPGPLGGSGGLSLKGASEAILDAISARPSDVLLGVHFGFYLLGTKFEELRSARSAPVEPLGEPASEGELIFPDYEEVDYKLLAADMAASVWTLAVRRVLTQRVAAVPLSTRLARLILSGRLFSPKREQMAWHEARYTPYPYPVVLEAGRRRVDRNPRHFCQTVDSFRRVLRWEPFPWLQGLLEATSLAKPLLKYAPDSNEDSYLADWWGALQCAVEHLIERQYLDLVARFVRWLSPAFMPETRSMLTLENNG